MDEAKFEANQAAQAMEQVFAFIRNELPLGLRGYYGQLIDQGFSEEQSFQLVILLQERLLNSVFGAK